MHKIIISILTHSKRIIPALHVCLTPQITALQKKTTVFHQDHLRYNCIKCHPNAKWMWNYHHFSHLSIRGNRLSLSMSEFHAWRVLCLVSLFTWIYHIFSFIFLLCVPLSVHYEIISCSPVQLVPEALLENFLDG